MDSIPCCSHKTKVLGKCSLGRVSSINCAQLKFKGATKFFFMWHLPVVIILFKRACISSILYLLFWKTTASSSWVFCLLCAFNLMSSYKLNNMYDSMYRYFVLCSLIYLWKQKLYCKSSIMTLSNKTCFQRGFELFY